MLVTVNLPSTFIYSQIFFSDIGFSVHTVGYMRPKRGRRFCTWGVSTSGRFKLGMVLLRHCYRVVTD